MEKTKACEITDSSVIVERDGEKEKFEADTVGVAAGSVSYNPLEEFVKEKGYSYRVVGDAKKVALAFEAVRDGFDAGREVNLLMASSSGITFSSRTYLPNNRANDP